MKPTRHIKHRAPSAPVQCPCGAPALLVATPVLVILRCERTGQLIEAHSVASDDDRAPRWWERHW